MMLRQDRRWCHVGAGSGGLVEAVVVGAAAEVAAAANRT